MDIKPKSAVIRLFLTLCVAPLLQPLQAQLNNVGPFLPGITTSVVIDSIASANKINIRSTASEKEATDASLDGNTEQIFRILHSCKHNKSVKYFSDSPIEPRHEVYHIDYLTVDGILYSEIWLRFWKDTLYSVQFNVSADKLQELIKEKFGTTIIDRNESQTKKVTCRSSEGVTTNGDDVRSTIYYKTSSKDLQAWCTKSKYYTSECEEAYSQYFIFVNTRVEDLVGSLEKRIEEEHERAVLKK